MRKINLSESELKERMKKLANISEAKHDSSPKISGIIKDIKECKDGFTYAIIKESQRYFIKKSKEKGKATLSEQFDYIGGVQDFLIEAHDSYQTAYNRFNTKINELNKKIDKLIIDNKLTHTKDEESEKTITEGLEEDEKDDIDLEKLKVVNDSKPENNPEAISQPTNEPTDLSNMGGDTGLPNNTPSNDSELPSFDEPKPEDTVDTNKSEPTSDSETSNDDLDIEDNDEESSEDSEEDGDLEKEVYKLMGKLGQKLRKLGDELDTDTAKNLLGQMITGTKEGLKKMEDSDVKKIAKKIEKRGEKSGDSSDDESDTSDENIDDELPNDSISDEETPKDDSKELSMEDPLKKK